MLFICYLYIRLYYSIEIKDIINYILFPSTKSSRIIIIIIGVFVVVVCCVAVVECGEFVVG